MNTSLFKTLPVLFLLGGCASSEISTWAPYSPPIEIGSETVYQRDLKTCRGYAEEYIQGQTLNPSQIAREGATGAVGGLPYIATSPATPLLAPALGAVGGSSEEALEELGVTAQAAKKVFAWCMHDKGLKDGFSTYDPNL